MYNMNMEILSEKIIGKTQMRNNFSSFYEKVRNGESLFISDRGDIAVALVPIDILGKESSIIKKTPPISSLPIFGMWKDRKDMENSVKYVNKVRKSYFRK